MQSAENGTTSLQTRERLGEQLIYYRREHNLSLHDLSRMSGVDIRHIDNLEAGKTNSDLKTLCALAKALGKKIRIDIVD